LTPTVASMTQINLSWTASTDNVGVVGYRIYRDSLLTGTATTTSYQDTGLIRSKTYYYTVTAYDAAGKESAQQNTPVSATTLSDTEKPTTPGNLTATAISMTEVDLSWSASTDNIGVVGYKIYRDGNILAGTVGANTPTFKDTGLTAGTKYSYTISAYDADNNDSIPSAVISVTTQTRKYTIVDFTNLVTDWLQTKSSPADVNNDGTINSMDLGIMMSNWQ
jgi:chitodextrinase